MMRGKCARPSCTPTRSEGAGSANKNGHLGEAELEALRAHGLEGAEHVKDAAQRPRILARLRCGKPFCTHAACPGLAPAAAASERAQQTKQVIAQGGPLHAPELAPLWHWQSMHVGGHSTHSNLRAALLMHPTTTVDFSQGHGPHGSIQSLAQLPDGV